MQAGDRAESLALALERREGGFEPLGRGPVAAANGAQEGEGGGRRDAAAAGGKAEESVPAQMRHGDDLAAAADDAAGSDRVDQRREIGVARRVGGDDAVFDEEHCVVGDEALRVGGIEVVRRLDVEDDRGAQPLGEEPGAARHAGRRRRRRRQHHRRREAQIAQGRRRLHQLAEIRARRGDHPGLRPGQGGEHFQRRDVVASGEVIEIGVAAIHHHGEAAGLDVPDHPLVRRAIEPAILAARERRHGKDPAIGLVETGGGGSHEGVLLRAH